MLCKQLSSKSVSCAPLERIQLYNIEYTVAPGSNVIFDNIPCPLFIYCVLYIQIDNCFLNLSLSHTGFYVVFLFTCAVENRY